MLIESERVDTACLQKTSSDSLNSGNEITNESNG